MASPEAIDRILKRYNIDPADYKTIRQFQSALRAKIGSLNRGILDSTSQYFKATQFSFPKYNVTRVQFRRLGAREIRYGLPGRPGLWSYQNAAAYVVEQMEK